MFHLKCLSTRLLFHDRNVIPSVLLASLVFNIVFVLKSKARSQTIQPAVVHEPHHGGSIRRQAWPTPQRYNKALVTNSALPLICLFLATGFWITAVQKFASNYVHFLLKGYSKLNTHGNYNFVLQSHQAHWRFNFSGQPNWSHTPSLVMWVHTMNT